MIDGSTFERLEKKSDFLELVHEHFYRSSIEMGVQPHFNRALAQDAYFQWQQDLDRIRNYEEDVSEPDHIKRSAHLIYWLRRFSPVNEFVIGGEDVPTGTSDEALMFMLKYGREYLAFNLGYGICHFYETRIGARKLPGDSFSLQSSFEDVQNHDLLRTTVHVMKTKMISPQAMVLVLKAIFLRP